MDDIVLPFKVEHKEEGGFQLLIDGVVVADSLLRSDLEKIITACKKALETT